MPTIPAGAPTAFPDSADRAALDSTASRMDAWLARHQTGAAGETSSPPSGPPAVKASKVEPPAGELAEQEAKPGMGELHRVDDVLAANEEAQKTQDTQNLKRLTGEGHPGMGELHQEEEQSMPHAEEVAGLVAERAKLGDTNTERSREIDAKLEPGAKAWQTEDGPTILRPHVSPLGMAFGLGEEQKEAAVEKHEAASTPESTAIRDRENALKQYAAEQEARRFAERLKLSAGEVPINLGMSEDGIALDTRPFQDKIMLSQRERLAKEQGYTSWNDMPEELARNEGYTSFEEAPEEVKSLARQRQTELDSKAEEWAKGEIVRAAQVGRHLVFVDNDPERTNEKIAGWEPTGVRGIDMVARDAAAILSPQAAISLTPAAKDFQPVRYGGYALKVLNAVPAAAAAKIEAVANSKASAKFVNGDYAGWWDTMASAAWGGTTEERLQLAKATRENSFIAVAVADQAGKLASETADSLGYGPAQTAQYVAWARFSGGAFGFVGGDLLVPDPVTMGMAAVGMGWKWGGAALKEFDYGYTAGKLDEFAAAQHLDYGSAIDSARKTDPVVADILEMRVAQEHQMPTSVRDSVRIAESAARDAADVAAKARAKAGINPGDEVAHAAASRAQAEADTLAAHAAVVQHEAHIFAAEQYEASDRALGKVAEKQWKDWEAAKAKADEAEKALTAHVGTHGPDIATHVAAHNELATKAGEAAEAQLAEAAARKAKTDAVAGAQTAKREAQGELSAAIAAKDEAAKTAAATKLHEADTLLKDSGKATHPLNVAIKDAIETKKKANAAMETARTGAMAAHTQHGSKVVEATKLEKALKRAEAKRDQLEALLKSSGIDMTSGVHPSQQIADALKQAVEGAKVAADLALKKATDAVSVVKQAHAVIQKAIKEAQTSARASGWRETFTQTAEDMRNGLQAYQKWQADGAKFEDIAGPAQARDVFGNVAVQRDMMGNPLPGMTVEPFGIFKSLRAKYGDVAVDHAMTERGPFGDLLRKILDNPNSYDPVALSQKEVELLQDYPTFMTMAQRNSGPDAAATKLVEAIEIARKFDPTIKPAGLAAKMMRQASELYDVTFPSDTLPARLGPVKAQVQQVIKGTTNLSAQVDDEMLTLVKKTRIEDVDAAIAQRVCDEFGFDPAIGARAGKGGITLSKLTGQFFYTEEERAVTQISALIQYMDTTIPLEYVGGKTFVNGMSKETSWALARRQMVYGDTRLREYADAMDQWARDVAQAHVDHADAMAQWQAGGTALPSLQSKVGFPEPVLVLPPPPALGPSGDTHLSITALSRAWLPAFEATSHNVATGLETSAAHALYQNFTNNESFLDYMIALRGHMRRPPGVGMGHAEFSASRAFGFGTRAAMHARVVADGNDLMYRAIGGLLSAEQVADMNKFVGNEWAKISDFDNVLDGFNRMGMPVTQTVPKGANSAGPMGDLLIKLVQTGRDENGANFFMGQHLLQKIDENLPKVTKELQKRASKARLPEQILGVQAEQFWLAQWKKSLITGTLAPNMHYWLANIAGDASQMWFSIDPATAVKQSFQNLPANIPGIGPMFQDFMSEMSYKAQGKPVLGSLMNAFFNPNLGRFWNGGEGVVTFKSGMTASFETLRKWAVEDGILDTFLHEELPNAFSRVTPARWQRMANGWSDSIAHFANFAQQRQRSGLYLELLQQGYTRDEARRLTLDALYDWKHATAEWELRGFAKNIPFYRFTRLQQKQVFTAFTDSFIKPEEAFGKALVGQSKLGHARSQMNLVDLVSQSSPWLHPESQAPYADEQAQTDAMAVYLRPSWARERGVFYTQGLKDDYVRALQQANGKVWNHTMTTQLPLTIVDGLSFQTAIAESMVGAVAAHTNPEMLAPDWAESFWEPSLNILSPVVREPMKAWVSAIASDPGGIKVGSRARVSPAEAELMNKMPGMDSVHPDSDTGELHAPAFQALLFRMIPALGVEVPKFMDASLWNNPATMVWHDKLKKAAELREQASVADPARKVALNQRASELEADAPHNVSAAWSWFFRRQMGIGPYPYNPDEEILRRQQAISEANKIISGELEHVPFQGYSPPVDEIDKKGE